MGNGFSYQTSEGRERKIEFNKGFSEYLFQPFWFLLIQLVYEITQKAGSRNCLIMAVFVSQTLSSKSKSAFCFEIPVAVSLGEGFTE